MTSNSSLLVIIFAGLFALFSAGGAGTVWLQSRSNARTRERERKEEREEREREREDDRRKLEEERAKLHEESGLIAANAAEVALRALRTELNAAYEDVERRRIVISTQDAHIEELGQTVRNQAKRIVRLEDRAGALENWAQRATNRFEQLKVTDMPPVPHEANGNGAAPS